MFSVEFEAPTVGKGEGVIDMAASRAVLADIPNVFDWVFLDVSSVIVRLYSGIFEFRGVLRPLRILFVLLDSVLITGTPSESCSMIFGADFDPLRRLADICCCSPSITGVDLRLVLSSVMLISGVFVLGVVVDVDGGRFCDGAGDCLCCWVLVSVVKVKFVDVELREVNEVRFGWRLDDLVVVVEDSRVERRERLELATVAWV